MNIMFQPSTDKGTDQTNDEAYPNCYRAILTQDVTFQNIIKLVAHSLGHIDAPVKIIIFHKYASVQLLIANIVNSHYTLPLYCQFTVYAC